MSNSPLFTYSVFNLRPDVAVKKKGGLILSWSGARVEIPHGAATGGKSKVISSPLPSAVRSYACPWLGPNLRLGSDVQFLWYPIKLRKPVRCFIPFTYAATIELTTKEATSKVKEALAAKSGLRFASTLNVIYFEAMQAAARAAAKTAADAGQDALASAQNQEAAAAGEKKKKDKKKGGRHERTKAVDYVSIDAPLLDSRSVFVLQSKLGEASWTLKKDVEIIQPTIHYLEWPSRMREMAYSAARFSEREKAKPAPPPSTAGSPAAAPAQANGGSKSSGKADKKGGNKGQPANKSGPVDIEANIKAAKDAVSPIDVAKKATAFIGGIAFQADELCDFVAIVIGTPSETVRFDSEGGLLRSPILHPLFSVRIPKLSLKDTRISTFKEFSSAKSIHNFVKFTYKTWCISKAIQIRKDLINPIHHFDPQLTEINECSNIYELDLGTTPLERPATLTLPLPEWYTTMIEKMLAPASSPSADTELDEEILQVGDDGTSRQPKEDADVSQASKKASKTPAQSNDNNVIPIDKRPKNLVLVYQQPLMKRQLVWRASNGDSNSDSVATRKKLVKVGPYRDVTSSSLLRGDNLNAKNGWLNLLLGLKGAQWKDVPINGPFTPRCLQVNTFQLGRYNCDMSNRLNNVITAGMEVCFVVNLKIPFVARFALLYSNDPYRTPTSKIAHMMTRLEALSVAPPGILLPCISTAPSKITLWIDCVPTTKLLDVLEERLLAGFIPLVQSMASPSRRCAAIANSAYQNLQNLLPPPDESMERPAIPNYGQSRYRVSGYDLLHVLLYNSLCMRVVVRGKVQIKTRGVFDCFLSLVDSKRHTVSHQNSGSTANTMDSFSTTNDESHQTSASRTKMTTGQSEAPDAVSPEHFITATETRFSFHDLISDTPTVIELEPLKDTFAYAASQRLQKYFSPFCFWEKLIQNLMNRRLEKLETVASAEPGNKDHQINNSGNEASPNFPLLEDDVIQLDRTVDGLYSALSENGSTGWNMNNKEEDSEIESYDLEPLHQLTEGHNVEQVEDQEHEEETEELIERPLPQGHDGDDEKTTREHFTELLDAFSVKNSPLLGFEVSKDICRRLTNIYDKGLANEAKEFINQLYEAYAIGRVDFYLVQPSEMYQVREKPKTEMTNVSNVYDSEDDVDDSEDAFGAVLGENDNTDEKEEDIAVTEREVPSQNQSNMKWNKNMGIPEPGANEPQPLASFDVNLIVNFFVALTLVRFQQK
ncbi:unnamed protein product [Mesocestoides corti]|uniref:Uncharacterized protein n=2 Tax=Mesocestoides corti TaxID=53468 RepID=A0A3P6GLG8_MESCO|nr:unnamed protein product [Mesocestoides corti]